MLWALPLLSGCSSEESGDGDGGTSQQDAGVDSGVGADAGVDAGTDGGADAGGDAGTDAGGDAGTDGGADAGTDAGTDAGADAGTDAGTVQDTGAVCSEDGWCWANPTPHGESVTAVWSTAAGELWAGGPGGQALHWDGSRWTALATGLSGDLLLLSGSGASDVWAAGAGAALARWDGRSWGVESLPEGGLPGGLSMLSPSDGWLTQLPSTEAPDGRLWRRTAAGWRLVSGATGFSALWGRSSTEVWALAGGQRLSRWDGMDWVGLGGALPVPGAGGERYTALWMSPDASTGWAVATSGAIARWSGSGWTAMQSPRAVRFHGVWGSGSADVWLVGAQGTLLHWDGQSLALVESGTREDLLAVHGTGPGNVWVSGGGGALLHRDARGWHLLTRDLAPGVSWSAVTGSAADNVWVFGRAGADGVALVWDGEAWRVATPPPGPVSCAWVIGPDDVWAVGASAHHWNGQQWQSHALPAGLEPHGIHGTGPSDIWMVGAGGRRALWTGSAWVDGGTADFTLHDVWGLSPEHYWAVGEGGALEFYNGAVWTPVEASLTPHALRGVWGVGPEDVWAVGDEGVLVHYNGGTFDVDTTSAAGVRLNDVWGGASDDAWAVGEGGAVFHFDGTRWRRQLSGTTKSLVGTWSTRASAWTAGSAGQVLHRR
ncbi:hypothetical protein [Pyxidicoccus sp. MSG2]|uniref:hypothetical protein n=1 Tax=Pyxidicoccus sp. MSG2 TaxID=2996790 RepID=UPI00226F432E|nr:hypothetical protein [Pyxidicoccus sp. MSG2]MCY1020160.1 hypothetical protein [Pyxidicoccus sp. MSG2]